MTGNIYVFTIVAVVAVITIAIRFAPFAVFRNHTPAAILYLGEVLPYAIMAMLVVYCLKGVTPLTGNHALPEIISVLAVVILHKWKHNTLLSILCGTLLYMLLVQAVFQ